MAVVQEDKVKTIRWKDSRLSEHRTSVTIQNGKITRGSIMLSNSDCHLLLGGSRSTEFLTMLESMIQDIKAELKKEVRNYE
jgi:hypothetical protein